MVTYHLQSSGSIRLHVTINGIRFRPTISKFKASADKWMNQRIIGKNSIDINRELDRIERDVEDWITKNPMHIYSEEQIKKRLDKIIVNSEIVEKRKEITEYMNDFLEEKKHEINPATKKLFKAATIQTYRTAFDHFEDFGVLELEQITKRNYHAFLNYLLRKVKVNTAGKNIKRMKAFFNWCQNQGLPINTEFRFWKTISEETEEETRALNSSQLREMYELVIDPVDIYQLAKKLHNKVLDPKQVDQLTISVNEARKQAIAMASIGPHKKDFWKLTDKNIIGNMIKYKRGKNHIPCVAPFRDNDIFHAQEFANTSGGYLFKRMAGKFNYYLTYIEELCNFPFHITAKTFRKTFGSIIWYELDHPNKMGIIMKAYGHKKESTTRKYLGIQDIDLEQDHEELFRI